LKAAGAEFIFQGDKMGLQFAVISIGANAYVLAA
jgi:hypothetical protein